MKEILIYVEKGYADWEISHIGFQVKSSGKYDVKVVSKTKDPLVSMSGMRIIPDYSADEIFKSDIDNYPMLILCGGMFWSQAGFVNDTAKKLVDLFLKNNKYVGAICDATTFLAYNNYVNGVRHTGNTIENNIRSCPNYQGHSFYVNQQCVVGGNFITANGTSGLEFTREILKLLEVRPLNEIEAWYQFRKNGMYPN